MTDEDLTHGGDAVAAIQSELRAKSPLRRAIEITLSLSVVVLFFVFVIPKVTGSEYSKIWDEIQSLTVTEILILTAIWFSAMLAYTGVLTSTLPGLTHTKALVVNFAGSAVSNVFPFGGALGVGATYAIDSSWGFRAPAITLSILVSGIWNIFAKLGMPLVALVLLLVSGDATGKLVAPAVIGVFALGTAATVVILILRSEKLADRIGKIGQIIVGKLFRLARRSSTPDVHKSVLDFRHQSIGLLKTQWWKISIWAALFYSIQFLLLFACLRFLGVDNITLAQAFAAFTVARLLETVPITPSGVGIVEAGAASALVSFGGDHDAATAAVFLFRGFIYLLEIPVGALAWVVWATAKSWRVQNQPTAKSAATA